MVDSHIKKIDWSNMERELKAVALALYMVMFIVEGEKTDLDVCKKCRYKRFFLLMENLEEIKKAIMDE